MRGSRWWYHRRGILLIAAMTSLSSCANGLGERDLLGSWGGEHLLLTLTKSGGSVEYDCATGTVAAAWGVGSDGEFSATGRYLPGHGGPIGEGEDSTSRPASYHGSVHGAVMQLTVTLTDSAQVLGSYLLRQGSSGSVFKCL